MLENSRIRRSPLLRLEQLEDRSLLDSMSLSSCLQLGDNSADRLQFIDGHMASFFATSTMDDHSSGSLSIDFEQATFRWESSDSFIGDVTTHSLSPLYYNCFPRYGDQPAELVVVGHGDGTLIGIRLRLSPIPRGEVYVSRNSQFVRYQLIQVDLDVDTNRDGTI